MALHHCLCSRALPELECVRFKHESHRDVRRHGCSAEVHSLFIKSACAPQQGLCGKGSLLHSFFIVPWLYSGLQSHLSLTSLCLQVFIRGKTALVPFFNPFNIIFNL